MDNNLASNCVAINILKKTDDGSVVMNKRGMPILFYWDGETDVLEDMQSKEEFVSLLKNMTNITNYTSISIAYLYFMEDADNEFKEVYNDKVIDLQDWMPFSKLEHEFAYSYIKNIMFDLYKKVFGNEYEKSNKDSLETVYVYMYTAIKEKYAQRITKITFIEYIRTEIVKMNTGLSKTNIDWLFNRLNEIFH